MADGRWRNSSSAEVTFSAGVQSYPEPTCYSVLALSEGKFDIRTSDFPAGVRRGLRWLGERVNSQGALTLEGDDQPHWSTSLFALTLIRLAAVRSQNLWAISDLPSDELSALRHLPSAIRWLLSWEGKQSEPRNEITLNSRLRGWPWISDTFSWVEPTSYAVLALKLYKKSVFPAGGNGAPVSLAYEPLDSLTRNLIDRRVAEAEQLLLDRACQGGGWNYGNRRVFGRELVPFLPTTALAALALQGTAGADSAVQQGLSFLRRELPKHPSTLALALAILCFHAYGQPTDEWTAALLNRQRPDGSWRQAVHLTALAVLALTCVTGGSNVFKL